MRELKFRAFITDLKVMVLVGAIDVQQNFIRTIDNELYSTHKNTEIMQYAGLKDKNGIDIYEGDVIKYTLSGESREDDEIECIEQVAFEDGCFVATEYYPLYAANTICEVIGNIHQNPELLTPSQSKEETE